ncbi:putative serine esterase-domain-containing protein, partial [Phakopsora pachyrhizi]
MSSSKLSPIHLVVIIHGLWGTPDHVSYLSKSLSRIRPSSSTQPRLEIFVPSCIQWTHTYDGIDFCAERVANDLDLKISDLERSGGKLTKFSCVGYSLGGLIARFLVGLLHSRTPSFFETVEPMNFTTFASPWVGMPKNGGLIGSTVHFFGSRSLSRTGNQIYLIDRYCRYPSSSRDSKNFPLLALLAHPGTNFYKALTKFNRLSIYANSINDRTVPFVTGAAEKFDGFQSSKKRASKILKRHPKAIESDFSELMLLRLGGSEVTLDSRCESLIQKSVYIEDSEAPNEILEALDSKSQTYLKAYISRLPFFLKPKSYPFKAPYNYFAVVFSPILVPSFLLYILGSFLYQSRKSRRRIKLYSVGDLGDHTQRIKRVGLMDEIEQEIIEDIIGLGSSDLGTLQVGNSISSSSTSTAGNSNSSDNLNPLFGQPDTEINLIDVDSNEVEKFDQVQQRENNELPGIKDGTTYLIETKNDSKIENDDKRLMRESGLSEIQLEMLENINKIPGLIKYFCFFDGIPNSHGAIIYRAHGLSDSRGKLVVKSWTDRFL